MNDYIQDLEMERAAAWADIKDSKRRGSVLVAQAIGIELKRQGELRVECLKLDYNGVYGYLPKNFISDYEYRGIQRFIGKHFEFVVSHIDIDGEIFAADRKKALDVLAQKFWKTAQVKDTFSGFVVGVDRNSVYLLVQGIPVRMGRREYSHTYYEDLQEEVFIGDSLDVMVTNIQRPNPKLEIEGEKPSEEELKLINGFIEVSHKALEVDPMTYINEYQEKSTYLGTIEKIHIEHGIFIKLKPRGITVRSGFPPAVDGNLLKEGDEVNFKIQSIDYQNRRIKGIIITPRHSKQTKLKQQRRGITGYGR
ncbi:30S ribosomal protein S1 [Peribacillus loiseleuriae]|uniref:30S ribosomal protein S1 n=1 Tax=Peribacillus loiseleuriae TaxID=1679170 RepID=UPI003D08A46B